MLTYVKDLLSKQVFWTAMNSIALIITLFWVIIYTKATRAMAEASGKMADAQSEEIQMRRRPVVTVNNQNSSNCYFRTEITNGGSVHAKARFKATVTINSQLLELPAGHRYNGDHVWELQARSKIEGHLDIENMLNMSRISIDDCGLTHASVRIDSWVIYYYDQESQLYEDENRNPVTEWYWQGPWGNQAGGMWIPEVSPLVNPQ